MREGGGGGYGGSERINVCVCVCILLGFSSSEFGNSLEECRRRFVFMRSSI